METNNSDSDQNFDRQSCYIHTLNLCKNKSNRENEISKSSNNETILVNENYLTRIKLKHVIEGCKHKKNWAALLSFLESIYSSKYSLSQSFLEGSDEIVDDSDEYLIEKAESETTEKDYTHTDPLVLLRNYLKRFLSGVSDVILLKSSLGKTIVYCLAVILDTQCCEYTYKKYTVDVPSLRRAYGDLFSLTDVDFFSGMKKGINQLLQTLKRSGFSFEERKPFETMNVLIILLEIPYVSDMLKFEDILAEVCEIVSLLPNNGRACLAEVMRNLMREDNRLLRLHQTLQQRLTLRLLTTEYDSTYVLNQDVDIINTVYVLDCVYYASILAGQIDSVQHLENERKYNQKYQVKQFSSDRTLKRYNDLSYLVSIHAMDCRYPLIAYEDFINEILNEYINIENDYVCFKTSKDFSFAKYSFLLNTSTKRMHLFYDNRMSMRSESSDFDVPIFSRYRNLPLKIVVDRERIVDDTLNQLEYTIQNGSSNLKKRLYIEFKNEETVDEGGVSKEFFQLIVEKLFNPDFEMFMRNEETDMFWFNPFIVEDMSREYKLIGIIVGLAIYNNVILDLKLPPVVYRKLMGKLGNFDDLKLAYPILASGLQELLNCDKNDISSIFDQTFEISLRDSFGNIVARELKENGSNIPLTFENRQQFVELYADFLLNESVTTQFNAFFSGFHMVVEESPLKLLFRPEEIELIICGSKNFDFKQLENVTKYDGGYRSSSIVIVDFWEIVHNMSKVDHSKLLQFATGSDRIPIGGMKNMDFTIIRNGPDTNRLPTAHTCYNTLLLPEYCSKHKLKDCLLKAVSYSTGFGIR